ncbi:hypothetical protein V8C35DRAFT_288776 [Trichoderma chlorosporum]
MSLFESSQVRVEYFMLYILICTLLFSFTYIYWSKTTPAILHVPNNAAVNSVKPREIVPKLKQDAVSAPPATRSENKGETDAGVHALQENVRRPSRNVARVQAVEPPRQKLAHTDYTIGWICALSTEYVAAQVFLDERHEGPEYVPPNDNNDYTLGKIGSHNVVIAVLPSGEYGVASAAGVARDMLHTFPNIRIGMMVGIGGGAPSQRHDIRLGDVVVSAPRDGTGGVFQYDFGEALQSGIFRATGFLNQPPTLLRTAVSGIKADYEINGHRIEETISSILAERPRLRRNYKRPPLITDRLYKSTVSHPQDTEEDCIDSCGDDELSLVQRPERMQDEDNPSIHYGLIASANQVMKAALVRDKLIKEKDVLCFEMEAAGLMNQFPCLVIRGICDYADSHKNKDWQGYAAMTAAAYTKDLLCRTPLQQVEAEKRISDVLSSVQSGVDKLVAIQQNKDDQEILEWLTPIDYAPQQRDYIQIRQPETGRWFLESEEYQTWVESDKHTLSCPGVPGAGKTIMTAVVIDNVYTRYKGDAEIGISYLYCDYRKQYEQKAEDLLVNLLKQLTQGRATIPDCVRTLYNRFKSEPKFPPLYELMEILRSVSLLYSKVFIVVDALDECQAANSSRNIFLSELFRLQAETNANIFATARSIPEIVEAFKETSSLDIGAKDEDVQKYLTGNMLRLPAFVSSNLELQNEIRDTMSKTADGMFLIVRLHIDALARLLTVGHVRHALRNLPTSLDETYAQAMTRIESQGEAFQELAKQVLTWLICAKRVLSVAELRHAVAVKQGAAELDEDFIPDQETLGSVCAGLVTIDTESGVIRLAHYTIQEYFDREAVLWLRDAEANITRVCLTYLSFRVFGSGYCETRDEFQRRTQLYPLYKYAANCWGLHAREISTVQMEQLILSFLSSEAKVSASSQAIEYMYSRMAALHLAAYFGLEDVIVYFFENGHGMDVRDADGRTPLFWAFAMGRIDVVKLLISYGAAVDPKDDVQRTTPLLSVSFRDHMDLISLLLENGADVNYTDMTDESPLLSAIYGGNEDVIKLLLDHGADTEYTTIDGTSPLSWALQINSTSLIKLLLENGADAKYVDKRGKLPLAWAVQSQNEGLVKLLLEHGADVEYSGIDGTSPLGEAVELQNESLVKLLLESGANPELADIYGISPLWQATLVENKVLVKLLLEYGADANFFADGFTPLAQAVLYQNEEIARLLLENGADAGYTGEGGAFPLWYAVQGGHEGFVKLLLENGAEANITVDGRTPLAQAVLDQNEGITRLLLEHGADVDFAGNGDVLVSGATEEGCRGIVKLLLEYSI